MTDQKGKSEAGRKEKDDGVLVKAAGLRGRKGQKGKASGRLNADKN